MKMFEIGTGVWINLDTVVTVTVGADQTWVTLMAGADRLVRGERNKALLTALGIVKETRPALTRKTP